MSNKKIDSMSPRSGRILNDNDEIKNEVALYEDIKNGIEVGNLGVADEGTASSGTVTSLTDTGKNFELNIWEGSVIAITVDGTQYFREVTTNDADTINWATDIPGGVSAEDEYKITKPIQHVIETEVRNKFDTFLNSQDADNNILVKQSGSIAQLWGNELADRPDYTTISEPTAFTLLNATLDTWVTDGTNDWVEV